VRAHQLLEDGEWQDAATCHPLLNAIERSQAQQPTEGEGVHWQR
jgi:hypothetical protein